jgi:hypothetical protein
MKALMHRGIVLVALSLGAALVGGGGGFGLGGGWW